MLRRFAFAALIVSLAGTTTASADDADAKIVVKGQYVEARNCDVWTGPCFANAELQPQRQKCCARMESGIRLGRRRQRRWV